VRASLVLVVEDDRKTRASVRLYLEHAGFEVLQAESGAEALTLARAHRPDLVVLDVMLPGLDGLEVCRILQAESRTPTILLTARTLEEDKLRGLELGADDYVTKPFSPRELVARVRAVLRRSGPGPRASRRLGFGDLEVDLDGCEVRLAGQSVALTPAEFRLLEALVRAPGRAFTRSELLERAFGHDYDGLDRTVDVHVKNLRRKLEPDPARPSRIVTVYGVGYKFSGASDAP
jgi:DNA-binding response OmpR family regulator